VLLLRKAVADPASESTPESVCIALETLPFLVRHLRLDDTHIIAGTVTG
jgi:hypothetical protein